MVLYLCIHIKKTIKSLTKFILYLYIYINLHSKFWFLVNDVNLTVPKSFSHYELGLTYNFRRVSKKFFMVTDLRWGFVSLVLKTLIPTTTKTTLRFRASTKINTSHTTLMSKS